MKVVFLGYMASGKSVIARNIAKELNIQLIDLDDYIEKNEGVSISTLFDTKGEVYFRRKEQEFLNELLSSEQSFVLSVGGGTPCYGVNMEVIKDKATSIYLKASINTLFDRLKNEKQKRPLVANISNDHLKEFIAKHLFERAPYYEKASKIITTDNKVISEVVDEIKASLI